MDPGSGTTFPGMTFQHSVARRHRRSMDTSHSPSRGHYMSASPTAVARASALRWVPYDAAVSTVRGLLGASHDDLALRMPLLTRALRGTFFSDDDAAAEQQPMMPPFSATSRFPEQELFVCADLSPVGPALQAVTQAMMQVAVKAAAEDACLCYYDAVGKLMRLLADKGYGLGQVIFNRSTFESEFVLLWSPL